MAPVIEAFIVDEAVAWTANDLSELLANQNPSTLPNAKALSNPDLAGTVAGFPDNLNYYTALLPNIDTPNDYVLKVNRLVIGSLSGIKLRILNYQRELGKLDALAKAQGIGQLVLPHSVFLSPNDPYLGGRQPFQRVYTIIEKVEGGQNLQNSLRDPDSQDILLALAATHVAYFQSKKLVTSRYTIMLNIANIAGTAIFMISRMIWVVIPRKWGRM